MLCRSQCQDRQEFKGKPGATGARLMSSLSQTGGHRGATGAAMGSILRRVVLDAELTGGVRAVEALARTKSIISGPWSEAARPGSWPTCKTTFDAGMRAISPRRVKKTGANGPLLSCAGLRLLPRWRADKREKPS